MSVSLFSVAGLFKIMNVGVLIGIGYYLFQTRLRSLLIAAATRLHERHKKLRADIQQAGLLAADLEAQLQAQRKFCELAAKRLEQWRAYQQAAADQARQEAEERARLLREKQEQQAFALQLSHARQALADTIVSQATEQLQRKYHDAANGASYLKPVITSLERP